MKAKRHIGTVLIVLMKRVQSATRSGVRVIVQRIFDSSVEMIGTGNE